MNITYVIAILCMMNPLYAMDFGMLDGKSFIVGASFPNSEKACSNSQLVPFQTTYFSWLINAKNILGHIFLLVALNEDKAREEVNLSGEDESLATCLTLGRYFERRQRLVKTTSRLASLLKIDETSSLTRSLAVHEGLFPQLCQELERGEHECFIEMFKDQIEERKIIIGESSTPFHGVHQSTAWLRRIKALQEALEIRHPTIASKFKERWHVRGLWKDSEKQLLHNFLVEKMKEVESQYPVVFRNREAGMSKKISVESFKEIIDYCFNNACCIYNWARFIEKYVSAEYGWLFAYVLFLETKTRPIHVAALIPTQQSLALLKSYLDENPTRVARTEVEVLAKNAGNKDLIDIINKSKLSTRYSCALL